MPAFVGGISRVKYPGEWNQDRLGSCSFRTGSCFFLRAERELVRDSPAQGLRGDAELAPNVEGEVALIGEAYGFSDLGDG